ncbi:hypothetical protein CLOM_g2812 [Closterium sp. NIES-68]|nr:hypothetical protein CLOM_g2812 [Closterium sp. NIES-68]
MEIITYVVDGQLSHKDSMGTEETLGRGCVQYMSAGTGVTHSEMNHSNHLQRFLQIWVKPNARGLKPNYGSRTFSKSDRHNKLQQVVTSYAHYGSDKDAGSGLIPVNQDVNIFVSEMNGVTDGSVCTFSCCQKFGLHTAEEAPDVPCVHRGWAHSELCGEWSFRDA